MNFSEFSLHEDLLKGIAAAGYVSCTPVQEQVLKASLFGDDLYVQSQTGTGKTAAYLVSIIQEMLSDAKASADAATSENATSTSANATVTSADAADTADAAGGNAASADATASAGENATTSTDAAGTSENATSADATTSENAATSANATTSADAATSISANATTSENATSAGDATTSENAAASKKSAKSKKALILVPTRELAVQVEEEAKMLASSTSLKAFSFYGGVGYAKQVAALQGGVDFVIGTPGRIIDLKKGGQLDLSGTAFLVIDEADRMFDMGFYPDLREILKFIPSPESRQTMLFSATLNTYVKNLAWEYTRGAKEITIQAESITVDEIEQELIHVASEKKLPLLLGILQREKPESVLIFCNTKRGAEVLGKRLKINGYQSEFIIGDMQQSKRLEVMKRFKAGKVGMLVATDVAARGIDVDDLAMVVNYDLPIEPENYVHRIGRTARAGKSGKAYTFCSEKDVYELPAIERYIEKKIPSQVCSDEMLCEDKSKNVYIKLDSYGYDYEDEYHSQGGRAFREKGRDGRGKKSDARRGEKRGSSEGKIFPKGRAEEKRGEKNFHAFQKGGFQSKASQRKKSPSFSRESKGHFEEGLQGLSFSERMEVYKKKYSGKPVGKKSGAFKNAAFSGAEPHKEKNRQSFKNEGGKILGGSSSKKNGNQKFSQQKTGNAANAASAAAKNAASKKAEKTGFFSRLKKLFGGK